MKKSRKRKLLEFELVGGSYSSEQAKELLMGLINHQINNYKLKNLQLLVQNETYDHTTVQRIAKLQEAQEDLQQLLNELDDRFFSIEVACKAQIEIKKELVHLN
ncbi:MAG TPA: hypothetical protein PKC24_07645 [Cyclobacteriaceae bacterium]|nr:hypothetical protein [Cyclobacteriaceae bacterium]